MSQPESDRALESFGGMVKDVVEETSSGRPQDSVKILVEPTRLRNNSLLTYDAQETDEKPTSADYADMVHRLRNTFKSGRTRPIQWRKKQLKALLRMFEENMEDMHAALNADLGRCYYENDCYDFAFVYNEATQMIDNLTEWAAPDKPPKRLIHQLATVEILKDPYGVALVLGTWNYPFHIVVLPLIGAIAAGNCVVIKPSELAQESAKFMARLIPKYLDNECYQVILGGVAEMTELLKVKFDYIFCTASTAVGKIISEAASKHLTPVTLELGGKCPTYIDSSANLRITAPRLMWGKLINAGQTCVAPDYVVCTTEVRDSLLKEIAICVKQMYGEEPKNSPDLARIINDRHFQRINSYLSGNGKVAIGGQADATQKYIAPTVLVDVKPTDPVMCDEIFGPILPIMTIANVHEAIEFMNKRGSPVALYIFSRNKRDVSLILEKTRSGTVCVNDVMAQLLASWLPYGGVGESGMGFYRGKCSFDTFIHKRGVLTKTFNPLLEKYGEFCRYAPYTNFKLWLIRQMTNYRPDIPGIQYLPQVLSFVSGILAAIGTQAAVKKYGDTDE